MYKTRLSFNIIKILDNYVVNPDSVFIKGNINWLLVDDFLFGAEKPDIITKNFKGDIFYRVVLDIWLEHNEYKKWLEFDILKIYKI